MRMAGCSCLIVAVVEAFRGEVTEVAVAAFWRSGGGDFVLVDAVSRGFVVVFL